MRKISCYWQRLKINEEREMVAKNVMRKIFVEQLSDLVYFNYMFGQISSKVLDRAPGKVKMKSTFIYEIITSEVGSHGP